MRVDGLPNIQAAIRTNVADLMSRLETGDVIKAKVLEITSDEVLLRLFDGSLLKAAAGDALDAKAGQTLTLTVTSKSEGTLFLETLKDQSRMDAVKPDLLEDLLSALNLKTTAKNLELAAEFIKAGISPTMEQFEKTSALMKDYKGLNAEKAVFMSSKGIQADQVKLELLSKLLDGNLKLGEQLKELQATLDNVRRTGTNTASGNTAANVVLDAATAAQAEKAASTNVNTTSARKAAEANPSPPGTRLSEQLQTNSAARNTESSVLNHQTKSADTEGDTVSKNNTASAVQKNTEAQILSASITTSQTDASAREQLYSSRNSDPGRMDEQLTESTSTPGTVPGKAAPGDAAAASDEIANTSDRLSRNLADNTAGSTNRSDSDISDPFSKIRDTIKELFVRLESGKLTGEPDLSKIHKELYDKLDALRTTIHNSGLSGFSGGEGATAASNLLDDSIKLLSQLNNNNVLYYQMPVNLSGQNTTAELYIMKRQQSKKRIDPHNSVMFISLDTNNLGRFETLIDVKKNNVTMNFRTERQEINDFVKENIKFLYTGLSESGYKLADVRYALIDSATPPLKLEQLLSKMLESNRNKVDMRI